ncbi:mothers against decapentaplegic homolog 6-like isoform X3 [Chiloscyllium plagiosum]|uniref:mothers against decapentaplegic homolog 6-like isoform X3 n=1 Tax=Chiloscyllium plagiosum TaxID=36176 RepID=UPI001CB87ACC|nr:mothers against decapentaplegic homolog 6-like isoform X3 [Chiloscyllium plagiosum]
MFRSRRSVVVRRLWQSRCPSVTGPKPGGENVDQEALSGLKLATHSLFKRLRDEQLELLALALEAQDTDDRTDCVCFPRSELRIGKQHYWPQLLTCKLFRWPDLKHLYQLKCLCICDCCWRASGNNTTVCCNPYHFSRLCEPDPTERETTHQLRRNEPTNHQNPDWLDSSSLLVATRDEHWCSVAYWEYRRRVGRMYVVRETSVSVFCDLPRGTGFCLGHLHADGRHELVRRTRGKIGGGILLSKEGDGVWAYNRSEHPVFASSPTLLRGRARSPSVHKVLPGYSLKVFDYQRARALQRSLSPELSDGPFDPHSVRISFAKGWGPSYSRQFITSCPCWLEILLNHS